MPKAKKTTPQSIARIIKAAMGANDMDATHLSKVVGVHKNTIYKDLRDPNGMTLERMSLYWTALNVPADEGLAAFADSFSRSLVR